MENEKFTFRYKERAALAPFPKGSVEEKALSERIEKMSNTWDNDPQLRAEHEDNFYNFLASETRK